ncbi:MAG: autotransporter-associated beta strand repeat-containing protein, partial [bacterium]
MKKTLLLIGISISVALFSVPAQAANVTWTNNSTSNWTNNSNWSGSAVPTASDDVSIPISLGAGNFTYVQITAAGAVANSVTLAPTGSATNAGAILVLDASSSASLTTGSLSVGGSSGNEVALQYNAAGTVTVTGSSMDLGAGSSKAVLNFGAPGTLTIGGGTGSITHSGAGYSIIYSRSLVAPTINAASVTVSELGIGDNANAGGSFNINSGQTYNATLTTNVGNSGGNAGQNATLTVNGGLLNTPLLSILTGNSGNAMNAIVNLNGGTISTSQIQRDFAGTSQTFNWNDGTITHQTGGNLTLQSIAGGANNLVLSLAGTGNHTFDASSGRTITVQSTATLANQSGQNGTLTKTGLGTLIFAGNNTYTGATTINAGTLRVNTNTGSISTSSNINIAGASTLSFDNTGASGALAKSFGNLTATAGDGTATITRTAAQDQAITFASLGSRTTGATINFSNTGGTNSASNGFILTGQTTNAFINQGTFFGGSNYAWYDTTGFVRGINYATDTNAESITASTATFTAAKEYEQITGSGLITAQTTQTITSLNIANSGNVTLAGGATLTVNGILKSGNATGGSITGGTGIRAANNAELVVRTDGVSDTLTIATPILANGTNAFTKSGLGLVTLSGGVGNNFTGPITVAAGVLGTNVGASMKNVTGNVTVASGATFNVNTGYDGNGFNNNFFISGTGAGYVYGGYAAPWGALNFQYNVTSNGTITLVDDATITHDDGNAILNGQITGTNKNLTLRSLDQSNYQSGLVVNGNITLGTGSVTVRGVGYYFEPDVFFSGNNTYTGGTTIDGSTQAAALRPVTLLVNKINSMPGTGTVAVLNNGALAVKVGGAGEFTNATSGAGSIGGLLNGIGGQGAPVTYAGNALLGIDTTNAGGSLAYSGNISNAAGSTSLGLIKLGSGTLSLSGNNTYTGATYLKAGTLSLDSAGAIGSTGSILFNGGTLRFTANNTTDYSSRISALRNGPGAGAGSAISLDTNGQNVTFNSSFNTGLTGSTNIGGLTKLGNGTLTLNATNTYTGVTTITGGTLQFAKTNAMPLSSNVTVQTGATLAVNAGGAGEFTNATSGNGSIGGLLAGAGGQGAPVSYSGDVRLGIDTTNAGGSLTYNGTIANVGTTLGLTKLGTGTFILSANNTYTGATAVNSGTLQIGSNGTTGALANSSNITVASGATLAFNRTDSYGGSEITNRITGNGTLAVNSGTLNLNNFNNNIGSTSVVAGATDAVLQINGSGAGFTTGTLTVGGNGSGTSFVTLNTDQTINAGSINLAAGTGPATLTLGVGALTVGGGTGSITHGGSGFSLIKVTGTVPLNAASVAANQVIIGDNAPGNLTISSGQSYNLTTNLVISNHAGGSGQNATLSSSGTLNTPQIAFLTGTSGNLQNATLNLNGGTISTGDILRTNLGASQTFNWNNGTITHQTGSDLQLRSTAASNLVVSLAGTGNHTFDASSGRTITVQSTATLADQSGQNGTLTKTGLGTLVLNGNNTYSG